MMANCGSSTYETGFDVSLFHPRLTSLSALALVSCLGLFVLGFWFLCVGCPFFLFVLQVHLGCFVHSFE